MIQKLSEQPDLWLFLRYLENQGETFFWIPAWGPQCSLSASIQHTVGIRPVQMWQTHGFHSGEELSRNLADLREQVGDAGCVFGALGYEAAYGYDRVRELRHTQTLSRFPLACFGAFPLLFHWTDQGVFGVADDSSQLAEWVAWAEKMTRQLPSLSQHERNMANYLKPLVAQEAYLQWVVQAKEAIRQGTVYQANLAHALYFQGSETPVQLMQRIHHHNPSPWAGLFCTQDFALCSNSPELLLKKTGNQLVSKPIAGTRPRGKTMAEDQTLKEELLTSHKERAEHLMLVDLIRNDLGRVCHPGTVRVSKLLDREPYQNVTHIVSTVQGSLGNASAMEALLALFPGGTITGTPKLSSMEVIDSLEQEPRGFYTGSMGWMTAAEDLEFNILIRTLQCLRQPGKAFQEGWLHVGAGIVADSDPEKEWQETLHKAQAWAEILTRQA